MLHPLNIEQKLGFDKLKTLVAERCTGEGGRKFANAMKPVFDKVMLQRLLDQVGQMMALYQMGNSLPIHQLPDVVKELQRVAIVGNWLSEEEFFKIKHIVQTIASCLRFFEIQDKDLYPALHELASVVVLDKALLKSIDLVIDEKGKVRDNASQQLKAIRYELNYEHSSIRKLSESLIRSYKSSGYCEDDTSVTIRNGRLVIPVAAEYKRKVKGFIIDESATGQTAYVEPVELLDTNNRIKELEYMEKREVVKLLTELTTNIRIHLPALQKAVHWLAILDFIKAKALLGLEINSCIPVVSEKLTIKLQQARHPLLVLAHAVSGKKVEPLTLELNQSQRVLMISGPNAGGKSVCLKTVGLFQYMFQSGLPVPASDGTEMCIFKDIFIDIGDEQSIENDLSTYSSHLTSMQTVLANCGGKSLVLIDEFGAGTEPNYGGAIAEAILIELHKKHVFGVITTHYSNLKKLAESTLGMVNGAMRYDLQQLAPLYQLEIGKPGSSFAFEIANKIGLSSVIIEAARKKIGQSQVNFDVLIAEVQQEKIELEQKLYLITKKEEQLQARISHYEGLSKFIEDNKKQILNAAKLDAKSLLQSVNKKIENTIKDIKAHHADKEITKLLRDEIEELKGTVEPDIIDDHVENVGVDLEAGPIEIGCFVRIIGQDTMGEVLQLKGKDVLVAMGNIQTNIKLNRLERVSKRQYTKANKPLSHSSISKQISEKTMNFSSTLDVRGLRGEEAMKEVEDLIDNAIILGFAEVKIIHGKGDGILRTIIRDRLKNIRQVQSLMDEHADRGGDGATIVKMKS
jgi:DNA mismatch repair protein MutS2